MDEVYTKGTTLVVGPHVCSALRGSKTALSIPDAEGELFALASPAVSLPPPCTVSATRSGGSSIQTSSDSSSNALVGSDNSSVTLFDSVSSLTTLASSDTPSALPSGQDHLEYMTSNTRAAPPMATVIEGCNCLNPGVECRLFDTTKIAFRPSMWMLADKTQVPWGGTPCADSADKQWRTEWHEEMALEDWLMRAIVIFLE